MYIFILFSSYVLYIMYWLFISFPCFVHQQVATQRTHAWTVWMNERQLKTIERFPFTSSAEWRLRFSLTVIAWSDKKQSQRSVAALTVKLNIPWIFLPSIYTQITADNDNTVEFTWGSSLNFTLQCWHEFHQQSSWLFLSSPFRYLPMFTVFTFYYSLETRNNNPQLIER